MTFTAPAYSANSPLALSAFIGGVSACTVYCVSLGPVGTILISASALGVTRLADSERKEIANAILNESQNYYQFGEKSVALEQFINLRKEVVNSSESEIVDELNNYALNILDEAQ